MHLSKEIQRRLDKLGSTIQLASTYDGAFPDRYSFYNKPGKSFRTEFAMSDKDFSIVLYERTEKHNYEDCFARGLFTNIDRLSTVIDLWVDKKSDIQEIQSQFNELEVYEEFETKNPNPDIDKAWTKVKNMFFNDTLFWKDTEWKGRYADMLNEAKRHASLESYFPFNSHDLLRFSIDKELTETWPLGTHILPTQYSARSPATLGKFYVSYNEEPMGQQYFETAKEALDFLALKLNEIKPTKW